MQDNPFIKIILFAFVKDLSFSFIPEYQQLEEALSKKSRKIFRPVNFRIEWDSFCKLKDKVALRLTELYSAITPDDTASKDASLVITAYNNFISMINSRLNILEKLVKKTDGESYPPGQYNNDVAHWNEEADIFVASCDQLVIAFQEFLSIMAMNLQSKY